MLFVEGAVRSPRERPEDHCPTRVPLTDPNNDNISADYWSI